MSAPFITIDALDGVGKTTLVEGLARQLGGRAMNTPGPRIRAHHEAILQAIGPDQAARCLFYTATVVAQGLEARRLAEQGIPVVMDRYWPSTIAYARARGLVGPTDQLEGWVPSPDVSIVLTLDESERVRRLTSRGPTTSADRETLQPDFCREVMKHLRQHTTIEVDVTGLSPDEAVQRVAGLLPTVTDGGGRPPLWVRPQPRG